MPLKKPAPRQEFETALDDALRSSRVLELYAALYPSLRSRVRVLLNSNLPGIREKAAAMIAAYANRGRHGEVWLQKRHALTQAEARIALFIGEGGTVAAYAERYRVSPATVRTHLKAIFAKTGVSRQAELAALLRSRSAGAWR